ncbi:trypsin-like peptidase domain-containing protein [Spirillospora sp. CA-294931]|uniref:VMAP-C domain-containing protein n=1 Tax=Spirillospora sp. CA-294931 TaxID=3240042 RepID=UPI003D908F00
MTGWQWRARVRVPDTGQVAAGFLVAPDRVLTCAHAVDGAGGAEVDFPGRHAGLAASVVHVGDWKRQGDDGDVAVLRLEAPVALRCAGFAVPGELDAPLPPTPGNPLGRRTLATYGFPFWDEAFERHASVRTGPDMAQAQEWWQLDVIEGERIRPGYSGAAVYDPYTGQVAGMVTDSDPDSGTARMLPLSRLRLHWEGLDDLLPLGWLTAPARRELRLLLDGVRATDPIVAEVAAVAGRPAPRRFRSAWDAVRFVAEGWAEERLVRLLKGLQRHLPELAAWSARHLPGAAAAVGGGPASVIVRLERVTFDNAYDLTVHTWIDGAEGPAQDTVRVTERQVRAAVEERVARAGGAVVGRDWMIEFAVPEGWLSRPFEEWYVDPVRRIPMRMYPVVVRDVERLRPDSIRRDLAYRRWRLLAARGRSEPQPVGCDAPRSGRAFQTWLEANSDFCVLVYGARPVKGWLTASLNTGVPVMLWPRSKCGDTHHGDCAGHQTSRDLAAAVAAHRAEDLPGLAMALRRKALQAEAGEHHCGRDLTLLWDDPSRLPDPPLAMEV